MAKALATPIAWFFEGLPQETFQADPRRALADQFLASSEGLELARLGPALSSPRRKQLLALIRVLAEDPDPQVLAKGVVTALSRDACGPA